MQEHLFDAAAERAVLAGVCAFSGDAYLDVADLLSVDSFTIDSNQNLWACLEHILRENPQAKVDYPSILAAAKSLGLAHVFDKPEEKQHLRAVMNFPVKLENVRLFAGIVKKLEVARQGERHLLMALDNIRGVTGRESIDQIIGITEQPIMDWTTSLSQSNTEGPQKVGDGLRAYAEYLAVNRREVVGVRSGFRMYDIAIGGGFRPGTVNVIGARPKTGKSLLANNIGIRVASGSGYEWPKFDLSAAIPVLHLDTEMTREDQWVRQLALISGVTIDDIETGKYASDNRKKCLIAQAIDKLEKMPYDFMSIAGQPFEETVATMRRWVIKRVGLNEDGTAKPCLIIFDYLKLMSSDLMESKNLAEFQVLGFMMTGLHNFAVRYKVPILTFIQLNRDGINVEDTSVASGSDRIIWLCSNFSIYKKKSDEEMAEQAGSKEVYNRKLVPIVARHGAGLSDGDYINMMSYGAIAKIVEGPSKNQLAKGDERPKGIIIDDTSCQDEILF